MHKVTVAILVFCFATSAWSADVLKDELINFLGAAGEYIGAGYKLSYVDQTECRKYPFKKDTANAFSASKNDVGKMIHGSMFNDLLKAIEPIHSQLRREVDVLIGSEPTAFQCGKAKGMASKSFEQSQDNWLRAVRRFNQVKQDQGLTQ
ncbi:MAG: hypothetical protein AAB274_01595 [Nitrospirota bacterium]